MKRKSPRRVAKMTPEERRYVAWLHTGQCRAWRFGGCDGPLQQAHERDHTGLGLKAPPMRSCKLCRAHHDQADGRDPKGIGGYSPEMRKSLMASWIGMDNEEFFAAVASLPREGRE